MRQFEEGQFFDAVAQVFKTLNPRVLDEADWESPAYDAWLDYGERVEDSNSVEFDSLAEALEEHDLSEDEAVRMIENQVRIAQYAPESKVEKWTQRISSGEATLEDACDDVSKPTYYKIRGKVDGDLPWSE